MPGSSLGNGMVLSGTSRRQSPAVTIQTLYETDYIVVKRDYGLCGSVVIVNVLLFMCGNDNRGKIFKASYVRTIKMNNLNLTNAVRLYRQTSTLNLDI